MTLKNLSSYSPEKRHHTDQTNLGPKVLLIGRQVVDVVITLCCTLQFLADAVLHEEEKIACEWSMSKRVGGFPAWAIRAVRKMGGRVWLSTVFPVPMPKEFLEFLDAWDVDTEYCTIFPGRPATTLHLSLRDGHRLLTSKGVERFVAPHVPAGIYHDFDLVLAKPGGLPTRRSVLRKLKGGGRPQSGMPPVAIVASADYGEEDLALLRDEPTFYVFCNVREAISMASGLTGNGSMDVEQAAKAIKSKLGATRLCVSLGRNGAMLLNGSTHISRGKPVDGKDTTGSGDKLATAAAMELAKGVDEFKALDQAVATVSAELAS